MTQARANVRGQIRSPIRGQMTRANGFGSGFHDGISFQASTGRVIVKATGASPTLGTLTSLFTFTSGNQSMYRGPGGLLVQSVTNTPRVEYGPGGDVYGLLMEASRTNLCLQSADISTSWVLSGATASVNATAAPDGTTTADKLVESAGGTFHLVRQDIAISANTANTFSIYVKASGRTACKLQVSNTLENTGSNVDIDLSAVTVSNLTNFGTGTASAATIEPWTNGWFRVSLRTTIDAASTTGRVQLLLASPVGTTNYSGDGASGLFLWGGQYEAGQFMSSHIPTTTVSVARTADSCIRTLASEFSATAGSVVVAGRASGGQDAANSQTVYDFNDGTGANRITILRVAAGDTARFTMLTASVQQGPLDGTFVSSTTYKAAIAFAANDLAYSFNGAAVTTDATATLPAITKLELGSGTVGNVQGNCHIRTFDYYPTRLANETLQSRST